MLESMHGLYANVYFQAFKHFQNLGKTDYADREAVRALFPEAYDAGELAAFFAPKEHRT